MPRYTPEEVALIKLIAKRTEDAENRFDNFVKRQQEWRDLKERKRLLKKQRKTILKNDLFA